MLKYVYKKCGNKESDVIKKCGTEKENVYAKNKKIAKNIQNE